MNSAVIIPTRAIEWERVPGLSCIGCGYLATKQGRERCLFSGMADPWPWAQGCRHWLGWQEQGRKEQDQ